MWDNMGGEKTSSLSADPTGRGRFSPTLRTEGAGSYFSRGSWSLGQTRGTEDQCLWWGAGRRGDSPCKVGWGLQAPKLREPRSLGCVAAPLTEDCCPTDDGAGVHTTDRRERMSKAGLGRI